MTKDKVREAYAGAVRSGKSVKAIYNVHLNGQVSDSIEITNLQNTMGFLWLTMQVMRSVVLSGSTCFKKLGHANF